MRVPQPDIEHFWQRRCRAAAAGAVLCRKAELCGVALARLWAVICMAGRRQVRFKYSTGKCQQYRYTMHQSLRQNPNQMDTRKRISCIRTGIIDRCGQKHNALLKNCKIIQNFLIKESWTNVQSGGKCGGNTAKRENKGCFRWVCVSRSAANAAVCTNKSTMKIDKGANVAEQSMGPSRLFSFAKKPRSRYPALLACPGAEEALQPGRRPSGALGVKWE